MSRLDVNRAGELEAFVTAIDRGGFSAAARALGVTPSAMSKLVARLEARLGTRLVHRSTRTLQLTEEGREFYERGTRLLADLDALERNAAASAEPRGRVAISASRPFGRAVLLPLVPRLLRTHPQLQLDISLTDRVVDLLAERADIAVRWGPLPSSDLVARKLGETRQVIVGSRAYLARAGTPRTVADLSHHERLAWSYRRRVPDWPLQMRGKIVYVPPSGRLRAADGESLRQLALAGAGLVRLSTYHIYDDLAAGRLVRVLQSFEVDDVEPIHALYLDRGGRLPARVRAVLDFLELHASKTLRERP